MKLVEHQVRLESEERFGHRVPPETFGVFLTQFERTIRAAISLTLAGRNQPGRGQKPPLWLAAASDVRFKEISGSDQTIVHYEAPRLGDAAPDLYDKSRQGELWPLPPPTAPETTGIDLVAELVRELQAGNSDSDSFDTVLLSHVTKFSPVFKRDYHRAGIFRCNGKNHHEAVLDSSAIKQAEDFCARTPLPCMVKVVGELDMIRVSTRNLALKLESGEEVRGVLVSDGIDEIGKLARLLRSRVLVSGKAFFRPSGGLQRIEVETFEDGTNAPSVFSKIPIPLKKGKSWRRGLRQPQTADSGVNAFFGTWPGDETDEEWSEMMKDLD